MSGRRALRFGRRSRPPVRYMPVMPPCLRLALLLVSLVAYGCSADPTPTPPDTKGEPEGGFDATVRGSDAGVPAAGSDSGRSSPLDASKPPTDAASKPSDAATAPVDAGGDTPGIDASASGADGGASDGGAPDGGTSNGGASDGGVADGGTSDGSASDGSAADGGTAPSGDGSIPQSPDAGTSAEHGPPYAVGTARFALAVTSARTLDVQVWYPADDSAKAEAAAGRPVADFETGAHKTTLTGLLSAAPDGCTSKTMHAADAPPSYTRGKPFPMLVFSHCMDCVRFSMFSVAEQLASRGFVVAAPDHLGGTIYDAAGVINSEFLRTRAGDIRGVIDALLDASATAVPEPVRGKLDASRIGAFGHSYGSITTGLVLQTDTRVKAGIMIAAPPESVLLSGVTIANIRQPGLFFEALEDNSITVLGNAYIEANYDDYPVSARLIQVADAGHWSFTDIAGLGNFDPGCGTGQRMTNPLASFRYLDNEVARGLTKSYVTAFFESQLLDDAAAKAVLDLPVPANVVTLKKHD